MDLLDLINNRDIRRTYLKKDIEKEKLNKIASLISEVNSKSKLNIVLKENPDSFKNAFIAKKLLYKNVHYFLVIKCHKDLEHGYEKMGYYIEYLALELEKLGLSSGFAKIGSYAKPFIKEDEIISAFLVFGYAPGMTRKERLIRKVEKLRVRKKAEAIIASNEVNNNITNGIKAVLHMSITPHVHFFIDDENIGCYVNNKDYFELGIAKLHFYYGSNILIPFGNHSTICYK